MDGIIGYRFDGPFAGDRAGVGVASAGDVNGDGFDDFIVGARGSDIGGIDSGAAYIVFGGAANLAALDLKDGLADGIVELSALDGTNGFRLDGAAANDLTGRSVSSAGDINGDGYDDLIVAALAADPNGSTSGSAYVFFGASGGFAASIDLSTLDGTSGFRIDGVSLGDTLGSSISEAGDIDGDGFDDIVVGVAFADFGGYDSGGAYVIFGNDFRLEADQIANSLNKNPTGTVAAEILVGDLDGNTITGGGGADAINGGAGNDAIHVADNTFFRIDGGGDLDTLHLDYNGAIDFGNLDENALTSDRGRIEGIEIIDITNTFANAVTLHKADVLDIDCQATDVGGIATLDNVLKIEGEAGDALELSIAEGWSAADTTTLAGYSIYTSGNVRIAVDSEVSVIKALDLSTLNGVTGFRLDGVADYDRAGRSVSSAGDINGDGFDDLIVGTRWADPGGTDSGAAYVLFGKAGGFASTIDLSTLDGTNGFRLDGAAADDRVGFSVSSAGDLNGDGFGDLIVGAHGADLGGTNSGAAYVLFGASGGFASTIELSTLDGTNGFRLDGAAAFDFAGVSVSSARDVNGDGFDDLIIGALRPDPGGTDSGAAYVLFGASGGFASTIDLSTLDGTNGFRLDGAAANDFAGYSVSSARDVNGDGFGDLIVGAYYGGPGGNSAGAAYVLFGAAGGFAPSIDLGALDGTNGFRMDGAAAFDYAGFSVSSAGDVNGDGFGDLTVGAPSGYSGATYVVFGAAGGFAPSIDLGALDGTNGFRLDGAADYDYAGFSVSSAGDVNGDGFDDLIVGAVGADPGGDRSGAAYVIYGNDFRLEATLIANVSNKNPTGTIAADILVGDVDVNVITGGGGADAINGGAGNDAIHVNDNTFFRIDGGGDVDTLHLDYSGAIDFGNLDGNALTSDRGRIAGIEVINVDNGFTNALTLNKADVLDIDCQVIDVGGIASLDNVLKIDSKDGGEGDTLALATADGWVDPPDILTLAGYAIYTSGNVRIAVDTDIVVTVS